MITANDARRMMLLTIEKTFSVIDKAIKERATQGFDSLTTEVGSFPEAIQLERLLCEYGYTVVYKKFTDTRYTVIITW